MRGGSVMCVSGPCARRKHVPTWLHKRPGVGALQLGAGSSYNQYMGENDERVETEKRHAVDESQSSAKQESTSMFDIYLYISQP